MYGNFDNAYGKMKDEQEQETPHRRQESSSCANGVCPIQRPSSSQGMTHPSKTLIFSIPNTKDEFHHLLRQYPIIVVKTWASWCQPCKLASKKFKELADHFYPVVENKQLVLLADNIDEPHSIHAELVSVVPTFFVYFLGKLSEHHVLTGIDMEKLSNIIYQCIQSLQQNNSH